MNTDILTRIKKTMRKEQTKSALFFALTAFLLYNIKKYIIVRKAGKMEFREWMEKIWEYCQEHWIGLAAVGLVVLILLLSVWLIRLARRDQEEETALPETPPLPEIQPDTENQPEAEEEAKADPSAASAPQGLVEHMLRSAEEAGSISGQKVESIELKIEKAQLTIHYAGGKKKEILKETGETDFGEKEQQSVIPETEAEAETAADAAEQENMPKKFGADNMNRARSGRVYTEEELREMIKE